MGRRISKEFLHPSILEGVNNKIGNLDSLETDAKGNMVQAINELVEKLDNTSTLRDSLADILENKGIEVTEEDDIDSLISKVEGIHSGLDIISATELPESGKENQICVITDNPTDKIIVTSSWDDINATDGTIYVKLGESENSIISTSANIQTIYRVESVYQNDVNTNLASYLYQNGTWVEFTLATIYILKDGSYITDNTFETSSDFTYTNGVGVVYDIAIAMDDTEYVFSTLANMVDVTEFDNLNITWIKDDMLSGDTYELYLYLCPTNKGVGSSSISSGYTYADSKSITEEGGTMSFDLSSYTGEYYITLLYKHYNSKAYSRSTTLTLTDIYFN